MTQQDRVAARPGEGAPGAAGDRSPQPAVDSAAPRGHLRRLASSLLFWALVGAAVQLAVAAFLMAGQGGPAWLIHLGKANPAYPLARRVIGPSVPTPLVDGEDGVQFWVQARDPLLLKVGDIKPYQDRPPFRSNRVGYPLLAWPWRLGGEHALLWGLLMTNVIGAGVGTWAAARIARNLRGPPWAGIAFALCPGAVIATILDTADLVATAFLVLTILAVQEKRWRLAIVTASAALLTKESFVFGLLGLTVLAGSIPLKRRLQLTAVPLAVLGGWVLYVRMRLGTGRMNDQDLSWPFRGYFRLLFRHGLYATDRPDQEIAVLGLVLAVIVVVAWWRRRSPLLSAAMPFAVLVAFLGPYVLGLSQNSVRVFTPFVTLAALDAFIWSTTRVPSVART